MGLISTFIFLHNGNLQIMELAENSIKGTFAQFLSFKGVNFNKNDFLDGKKTVWKIAYQTIKKIVSAKINKNLRTAS